MKTYSQKLKDPRWQRKRLEILERDEWTCKRCLDTEKTLHVHHRRYIADREPWEYPESFFITLCEDCHAEETDLVYNEIRVLVDNIKDKFWGYEIEILNAYLGRLNSKEILGVLKNG